MKGICKSAVLIGEWINRMASNCITQSNNAYLLLGAVLLLYALSIGLFMLLIANQASPLQEDAMQFQLGEPL